MLQPVISIACPAIRACRQPQDFLQTHKLYKGKLYRYATACDAVPLHLTECRQPQDAVLLHKLYIGRTAPVLGVATDCYVNPCCC